MALQEVLQEPRQAPHAGPLVLIQALPEALRAVLRVVQKEHLNQYLQARSQLVHPLVNHLKPMMISLRRKFAKLVLKWTCLSSKIGKRTTERLLLIGWSRDLAMESKNEPSSCSFKRLVGQLNNREQSSILLEIDNQ
jgi:hypothetical protein